MTDYLTKAEATRLQKLEATIESGLQSFVDVGTALLEIREKQLYRQQYDTFEDYCRERWDLDRKYAYRLMKATTIRRELADLGASTLPVNESQVRPLSRLKTPEERLAAWERAQEMSPIGDTSEAPHKPPPQSAVQQAVEESLPRRDPSPQAEKHQCPDCGVWHTAPAAFWKEQAVEVSSVRPGQSELRRVQRELEKHFASVSGVKAPKPRSERDRKAAAVRWWKPLREVADLVGWDLDRGRALIGVAFEHLNRNRILVEAPQALLKTARAIAAGQIDLEGGKTGLAAVDAVAAEWGLDERS